MRLQEDQEKLAAICSGVSAVRPTVLASLLDDAEAGRPQIIGRFGCILDVFSSTWTLQDQCYTVIPVFCHSPEAPSSFPPMVLHGFVTVLCYILVRNAVSIYNLECPSVW